MSNAQNLHTTEFDSFDMRNSGVDLYSINGCKTGTTKRILENSNKDNLGNISITYDLQGQYSGDGTVPLESSGDLPINQANEYYALKSDHSKMLSLGGIRQEIVNLISGSNLATKDILGRERITQDISKCELSGDYYKMKSPVDIDVTDQDGNHSGLINGAIQNDIPNANFEIMGDHKFVYLPNDEGQKYTINLKGTGSGTFTFEREKISGNNITGAEIFSNIPVTTSLIGKVNPGSITTLSLDNNGDGKTDQTVQPSSTINSDQSQDLISPVSKTTITGTIGQSGFYRSNITINISAIDPVIKGEETETSGLLKTNYNLDNTGYKIYSMPASVSGEGQHSLKFFSTDKAGNNEMEQSVTFIIDKKSPEPKISIDPTTKDLKIESTETDATILKSSNTYTITDKSGNTTKLFFQETFSGKLLTYAKLTGVQYNTDKTINLPNSSFVYLWNILKNPQTLLSQTIAVDNTYAIEAVYDIKKDQTTTLLKKKGTTIQKQIFTGLHVSKLTLNKGVVGFEL